MAQLVKNPPAIWEPWVRSRGQEDPLEEGKATHSSILAWRIPWTEEPGWAAVHGVTQSWTRRSGFHFHSALATALTVDAPLTVDIPLVVDV